MQRHDEQVAESPADSADAADHSSTRWAVAVTSEEVWLRPLPGQSDAQRTPGSQQHGAATRNGVHSATRAVPNRAHGAAHDEEQEAETMSSETEAFARAAIYQHGDSSPGGDVLHRPGAVVAGTVSRPGRIASVEDEGQAPETEAVRTQTAPTPFWSGVPAERRIPLPQAWIEAIVRWYQETLGRPLMLTPSTHLDTALIWARGRRYDYLLFPCGWSHHQVQGAIRNDLLMLFHASGWLENISNARLTIESIGQEGSPVTSD